MNKDDARKLAKECGMNFSELAFKGDAAIITCPLELLDFANACEKIGMEKAAKICVELSMNSGTPKYREFCEDAIRAHMESI